MINLSACKRGILVYGLEYVGKIGMSRYNKGHRENARYRAAHRFHIQGYLPSFQRRIEFVD